MNATSLSRSTSFWLLLILSVAAAALGGWLVWDSTTTMLTTILDGTATNVEVYVGQAWITSGAALLGAGLVGIFLSLVMNAAKVLIPRAAAVVDAASAAKAPSDSTIVGGTTTEIETDAEVETDAEIETDAADEAAPVSEGDAATVDGQNGSSGSIATATNSSVR